MQKDQTTVVLALIRDDLEREITWKINAHVLRTAIAMGITTQ